MKLLILDTNYGYLNATRFHGGAEKAAHTMAKAFGAPLYSQTLAEDEVRGVEIINSDVPPRSVWTAETNSREMMRLREAEIVKIIAERNIDVVVGNNSGPPHCNLLRRLRKTGVGTVHVCHMNFSEFSLVRFSLATTMSAHRQEGGVNLAIGDHTRHQLLQMIEKKPQMITLSCDPEEIFEHSASPFDATTVPEALPVLDMPPRKKKIFVMTRHSVDKRIGVMKKLLIGAVKLGWLCEVHLSRSDLPQEQLDADIEELALGGVNVCLDVPQRVSFDVARTCAVSLMTSVSECSPIVPCEMAALGLPTIFCEAKSVPHPIRYVLPDVYDFDMMSLGSKPTAEDLVKKADWWWKNGRPAELEMLTRSRYQASNFKRDIEAAILTAQSRRS